MNRSRAKLTDEEYFVKHFIEEGYTRARLDQRKIVTYKDMGRFFPCLEKVQPSMSCGVIQFCYRRITSRGICSAIGRK